MPEPAQKKFWRRARVYFRHFRITILLCILAFIIVLLYFNVWGLPGFIKRPLLENLRAHGLQVEFKDLRLSWHRGLVAYKVRFVQAQNPTAPRISAERVELALNGAQLLRHLKFQIGGLVIHNARVAWSLPDTNEFALENVYAELRFLPGDQWQLDNLQLKLGPAQIRIGGTLTNASAITGWKMFQGTATNGAAQNIPARLQEISARLAELQFAHPPAIRLNFSGDALHPESLLVTLRARLDEGGLIVLAAINPSTRELRFEGGSNFDPQKLRPVLPEKAAEWIAQFAWEQAPDLRVAGSLILPADRPADLSEAIVSSARLSGWFKVLDGSFRGISALAAESHFTYSNHVLELPDLVITRPEGELAAAYRTDDRTQDFYWHLHGTFDPQAIRPLLDPPALHVLDLVHFTVAPVIDADLWGRWHDHDRLGVQADVTVASNFTFRGETAASVHTQVEYTNLWLKLVEPRLQRAGGQYASFSGVDVDFAHQMLYLSNGVCRIDPAAATRAIGTRTARIMEPYQFLTAPSGRVNGTVSLGNDHLADLHFSVDGGPFHWWKLNATHVAGNVDWVNETLVVTNVAADLYGGNVAGALNVNFHPAVGNDFAFDFTMDNSSLGPLVADLSHITNGMEGYISGRLVVTHANTDVPGSWQGGGHVKLRNGLLWEIPVFGVFAPVLNAFYPNLGSGRASSGSANFTITNDVIRSDNLELNSPAMRMEYRGTVDFNGDINAHVEAELLRGTWGIGPLVSTVLWPITKILEYKVTGDLSNPKVKPLYLPKAFLFPFHPIESLKELMPANTNAPPKFTNPPPEIKP